MDLYTRQNLRASWNGVISTRFLVSNGIWQGGVLSLILFNVHIDELLLRMKQHNIGNGFVGGLCYADQSGRSPEVVAPFSATNFSSFIIKSLQLHDATQIKYNYAWIHYDKAIRSRLMI